MHIEPDVVAESKLWLSYLTAAGVGAYTLTIAREEIRSRGLASLAGRSLIASLLVFFFFEVLPHYPIGVSEIPLILGSTLFLLLGAGPAAIGLAAGLLLQGIFFAPFDLPRFGMNVTTLLVPLFALAALARRLRPLKTPYVDLRHGQALALSTAYQAGIVSWVAFRAFYGQGFTATNAVSIGTFGGAYMLVIIVEPLVDLAVLAFAKGLNDLRGNRFVYCRLFALD